LRTKPLLNH